LQKKDGPEFRRAEQHQRCGRKQYLPERSRAVTRLGKLTANVDRKISASALSLVALVVALAVRWLLDPLMGDSLPLVTLFGAIALAVWIGGPGPAIAVTLLGYIACAYLFIAPRGGLGLDMPVNLVGLIAYLFTSAIIIWLGQAARVAQRRSIERGELLRVTLRSIGDGVITTDLAARVTSLNGVAAALTGWSQEAAQGQALDRVFQIVNEESRQPVMNPATRALREGVIVGLANHTLLIDKAGNEHPIDDSAAPIRDELDNVSGCVLIFRDVTQQRHLEREKSRQLQAARLLASIVESSEDAIISKSLDGIVQSWNAAAERLFGHPASEATGRHISLVIPAERIAEEDHIIERIRAGKRIEHFETERVHRNGERIHVSLTISPIKDESGAIVGASKIVRDITARKRVEAEQLRMQDDLRRLAADLSEANRRKNEFIATLAHELRNPLAPLSNMLEVLKRADGDATTLQRARATIERQVRQLVRLVDDLLDLNRVTHDRLDLRIEDVELATVIQHAVESAQPLADAAGHRLEVLLPAEPLVLRADPARLAQVFGNLLNNAYKYTPPHGTIRLTAQRSGEHVVVSISDSGIGIAPEKLDAIFDMFTQLGPSLLPAHGGLGIGLTLVRQLVTMHGGSVEARSAGPGQGSEFVVRLPVLTGSAAVRAEPPPSSARPTGVRRRVLVVDDNQDAAVSLTMLLQLLGHETFLAHDGIEALTALERERPDMAFVDIGLPKLSGHEVCRRVRSESWGNGIVMIALTGWGQDEDRRRSKEAGFDGHLVKPVDHDALAKLLDSLATRRPG
jgi:PAS domain S-box-containing protein